MSRRRKGHGGGEGHASSERWLLTYADMITLLLALFILLYAMSSINPKTFDSLKQSLSSEFHGQIVEGSHDITQGSSSVLDSPTPADTQDQTLEQIQQQSTEHQGAQLSTQTSQLQKALAQQLGASSASRTMNSTTLTQKGVTVGLTQQGIDIRLAGDTFFEPGSAQLNPAAEATLTKIAQQLAKQPATADFDVKGHTDGVPISGTYPNNLALSDARALTVAMYLSQQGHMDLDTRFQNMGFGSSDPIVQPPTPTTPEPKNRTVDIVLSAPQGAAQAALAKGGQANSSFAQAQSLSAQTSSGSSTGATPAIQPANPIGPVIDQVVQAGGGSSG